MADEKLTRHFGLTPELVEFIKREEGWVAKPYICPAGFPTIGYGHRIPSMDQPSITQERGEALLLEDLKGARNAVIAASPDIVDEPERRLAALVDFVFNLGIGRYKESTLKKKVDAKDWPAAGAEMRRWVYAAGRVFQPLVRRRDAAARWIEA